MSEALDPNATPETTLETGGAPAGDDRRTQLAAALDSIPQGQEGEAQPIVPAPEDNPAKVADPAAAAAAAAAATSSATAPPTAWPKANHELFTKADPALQAYIVQREEEMRKGVEPLIPKAKFADDFGQVLQPFNANLQAAGVAPLQAVQTLMQADNILRNAPMEQKVAYAKQLLTQYGVDMSGTDWSDVAVDPRVAELQKELHNLRNQVQPLTEQQVEAQNRALLTDIETFAKDRPHFEAVRPAMAQLLQSGKATTLQDAYDKAMEPWGSVLTDAEAGRQAAAEVEKRKAADAAAKAAKAAAVQVRTASPGRSATPPKAQDRRAMLNEQLDGIGGRV